MNTHLDGATRIRYQYAIRQPWRCFTPGILTDLVWIS